MTLPANASGNAVNADNEMTAFNGVPITCDAAGNLFNDGTNTYTWDARNHLVGLSGGTIGNVVYDPFGRRLQKMIGSTTTQFLYDGLNPVQELDGASPPNVTANLLTGLRIDEYFQRTDASGAMAFLRDALGSTLALTDPTGAVNTSYTYEPLSNAAVSGPSANPYQFTGRENDGTGLYFYRARYYSPVFLRFIAQDPTDLSGGSPNLYLYAFDNPVMRGDPSGEGPRLALAVAIACWGSQVYSLLSDLWQLSSKEYQIFIQENQLNQQINNLWQQQSSCPVQSNFNQIQQLQQQYNQLQQQGWNLAYQFVSANFAMSFTGLTYNASCALAVAIAYWASTP